MNGTVRHTAVNDTVSFTAVNCTVKFYYHCSWYENVCSGNGTVNVITGNGESRFTEITGNGKVLLLKMVR